MDVDYNHEDIYDAIRFIESNEYQNILNNCNNPYGDGKASEKICKILKDIKLDDNLLNKQFFELM